MMKVVKRAYKYRFYPTPEQAAELTRTFGCVRKVWNLALQARTTAWKQRHEHVSYLQSSAMLTQWKHSDDLGYLNQVSSVPLQQAPAAPAVRLRPVLGPPGPLPQAQVAKEIPGQRGVHPVGVPVPRRPAPARQDDRAAGGRVVPPAAGRRGTVHGDRQP
jgi:hypothetical protein